MKRFVIGLFVFTNLLFFSTYEANCNPHEGEINKAVAVADAVWEKHKDGVLIDNVIFYDFLKIVYSGGYSDTSYRFFEPLLNFKLKLLTNFLGKINELTSAIDEDIAIKTFVIYIAARYSLPTFFDEKNELWNTVSKILDRASMNELANIRIARNCDVPKNIAGKICAMHDHIRTSMPQMLKAFNDYLRIKGISIYVKK